MPLAGISYVHCLTFPAFRIHACRMCLAQAINFRAVSVPRCTFPLRHPVKCVLHCRMHGFSTTADSRESLIIDP